MGEIDEIRKRYEARKSSADVAMASAASSYSNYITLEREKVYKSLILSAFDDVAGLKFLEIGAGSGYNLPFFHQLGIPWSAMYANELLTDRVEQLKERFPQVHMLPGNALELPFNEEFDIVFQSTVFTSILDDGFRAQLAERMWQMVRPGGMVLWYDFIYNNPGNHDVKGVPVKKARSLFGEAVASDVRKVTLAPPIGRRVGRMYPLFNAFPVLRSHVVIAFHKRK